MFSVAQEHPSQPRDLVFWLGGALSSDMTGLAALEALAFLAELLPVSIR